MSADRIVEGVYFFPGTNPNVTDDQLREQFRLATEQIIRGEAEEVTNIDDGDE